MKAKTEKRKAAEYIAKKRGIKINSAAAWINRVASGKVRKPKYSDLGRYGKSKISQAVKAARHHKYESRPAPRFEGQKRKSNFQFGGTRVLRMWGRFELGSSGSGDIRYRAINQDVDAELANEIMNAESAAEALELFEDEVGYVADVIEFDRIEFNGKVYRSDHFGED